MFIIICTTDPQLRERWDKILSSEQHSVYPVGSIQDLKRLSSQYKTEETVLLIETVFATVDALVDAWGTESKPKFFFLSNLPQTGEGISFLRKGAVGYANTYINDALLVRAVETIAQGKVWVGQNLMLQLIKSSSGQASMQGASDATLYEELSKREKEIAELIAAGLSNKNIADKLYISERTVKSHLTSIFSKTKTENRLQLALLVKQQARI